uniref:Alkaline phosphatase n=1 Tax=Chrysotila carterae TaxID=13221 RepID=A0A7S4BV15_CHRCT
MPSTYSQYIEVFNAVTAHTLATAGECMVKDDWQTLSPRQKEEGVVCFTGPFDGHFALGHELPDGQMVMRIITNSEIRPRSSSGFTGSNSPGFYVSTNPATGGFGQPEPAESEKFALYGATLMYLDVNRTTLEVLDIGQAIKHVFTPKKELHNTLIPADASSADVYAILDDYATLNNNIRADQPTPREVSLSDCEAFPEWCGLYAHCGSSYSMKHGHSYASPTTGGVKVDGVGFEDNVAFIAHEGSQGEGGIAGTVQVLDVDTGDQYQLPQLSIGEIENAFAISTGESEHVAVVIMDYGAEGFPEGNVSPISYPTGRSSSYGSRVTLWIGKKDKTSAHFLDRNGLGLNQGRVYVFVADSGVTDTATMLNWPNSSRDCNLFTPTPGRFEPLPTVFDGRFYVDAAPVWTYDVINSLNTLYGNEPVRMTGVASQARCHMTSPASMLPTFSLLSRSSITQYTVRYRHTHRRHFMCRREHHLLTSALHIIYPLSHALYCYRTDLNGLGIRTLFCVSPRRTHAKPRPIISFI